jgi:hypothetical protein
VKAAVAQINIRPSVELIRAENEGVVADTAFTRLAVLGIKLKFGGTDSSVLESKTAISVDLKYGGGVPGWLLVKYQELMV